MAQASATKSQARTAARAKAPVFLWEAKTRQGEVKKGEMEANDAKAVENRLLSLGLQPTKVKKKSILDANISLPGSVGSKDILIFTRQFATMIDAGLPLVQCLDILGSQADNAAFRKVIFAIKNRVESGSTLSRITPRSSTSSSFSCARPARSAVFSTPSSIGSRSTERRTRS